MAATGKKIKTTSVEFFTKTHVIVLKFEEVLPVGVDVGKLIIPSFVGELNDQLAGFYRSEFTNEKGERELM